MSKQYSIDHYEDIDTIEKKHFWFIARNEMLKKVIKFEIRPACTRIRECKPRGRNSKFKKTTFLEVGCGTGIVIRLLESMGLLITGLDINARAFQYVKKYTSATLVRQSFLTYSPTKKYDAVGMFDVLEHISDDLRFLKKAHTVLKKNGVLFLTVPSGVWLWSDLDTAAGHIRRYEPQDLVDRLQKAGFHDIWWNYWGVFTLPFLLFWRYVSRMRLNENNLDVYFKPPKEPFNTWILWLMKLEHWFLFRIKWRIGATIVISARK